MRPQRLNAPKAAVTPVESPGEIYKAAMHPLDIVRSSLDNWSDAELGALTVGIHKAHDACEAGKPDRICGRGGCRSGAALRVGAKTEAMQMQRHWPT